MTFDPEQPRDEQGRWAAIAAESSARFGAISSDLFANGMTRKGSNGEVTFSVMRGGSEFGNANARGGTWYEVRQREDQRSRFAVGAGKLSSLVAAPPGVGGRELHTKEITLKNPLMINMTGKGEGLEPVMAYKKLTGESAPRRGLGGMKAEAAYAKIEVKVSTLAKRAGFDGIVFYDAVAGQNYPRHIFDVHGHARKP